MRQFPNLRHALYLGVTLAVALVSVGAQSAANRAEIRSGIPSTPVEEMFADAPYGVDPMVTGPVSAAFKQQQDIAGCDKAVWPNIPAVCYPK